MKRRNPSVQLVAKLLLIVTTAFLGYKLVPVEKPVVFDVIEQYHHRLNEY